MAKPREVLEECRGILRQPTTLTSRRNAVRTFHDFLKVLLKGLARPEDEFLGQVDLKKRVSFEIVVNNFQNVGPKGQERGKEKENTSEPQTEFVASDSGIPF